MKFFCERFGIKFKLTILAILPALLISLALTYYLTKSQLDDVQATLASKGELIVTNLAPSIEFGLFSKDLRLLKKLTQPLLKDPEVIFVAVYDNLNKKIYSVQSENYEKLQADNNQVISEFKSPVYTTRVETEDYQDMVIHQSADELMGWVSIEMSHIALNNRQSEIIYNSLLILFIGLLISWLIAYRLGIRFSKPALALTEAVERISIEQLGVQACIETADEMSRLQAGFDVMIDAIHKSHEELKLEVDAATKNLRETVNKLEHKNLELEVAKSDLEQAIQAKSEFLAKMSHEIRTPLNAVIGFANLIQKTHDKNRIDDYTRTIDQAGSQLLLVIDDIINYSRLEEGFVSLHKSKLDIRDAVEDIVTLFVPAASEKQLLLNLIVDADVPATFYADVLRINQILNNLINNALKFTNQGSVTVHISLVNLDIATARLRFEVIDTGIGLDESSVESLFDAFSQVDTKKNRAFQGSGLGLAIVKRLVLLMSGEIGVKPNLSAGSIFWFELTLAIADEEAKGIANDFQGSTFLLMQPEAVSRRIIRNQLLSWKSNVYAVANITECLARLLDTQNINLLFVGVGYSPLAEVKTLVAQIRVRYHGKIALLIRSISEKYDSILLNDENIFIVNLPIRRRQLKNEIIKALNVSFWQENSEFDNKNTSVPLRVFGQKVLVVEDNNFNRQLIKEMLNARGFNTTLCSSAHEALIELQSQQFNIVFVDMHMPDMDGFEFAGICRENYIKQAQAPIIAFTADVVIELNENTKKMGLSDVLYKPISDQSLDAILEKWIDPGSIYIKRFEYDNLNITSDLKQKAHDDIYEQIKAIGLLISKRENNQLHEQLHQLEGVINYFSFAKLRTILSQLKQHINSGNYQVAEVKLNELQSTIDEHDLHV